MAAGTSTLVAGTPRLGWLIDGNHETPEVAVLLVDDGTRILLTVPWTGGVGTNPYERWFLGDVVSFGDDPAKVHFDYRVPEVLWFQDSHGFVTLVGCDAIGSTVSLGGPGQGTARVTFAVLGACGDFRTINGLRAELPGLGDWVGLKSVTREHETDGHSRLKSVEIKAQAPEPIRLDRRLNLTIRPNWSTSSEEPDSTIIRESLIVESLVSRSRTWEEHLSVHHSVLELLDIATWTPNQYLGLMALRHDEPERATSVRSFGPQWAPVATHRLRRTRGPATTVDHLFSFHDIGVRGFRRWLRLRTRFERGLRPMLALLDLQGAGLQTRVAQSGLAYEAIGFQLALEAGTSRQAASNESHKRRLERVAEGMPPNLMTKVVPDLEDWVSRSARCYNAVKHADRVMPEPLELLNTERENELIFRAWVAHRLGVETGRLRRSVERDRLASPYEPA